MSLNIGNVFDANFYRAANSDLAGLNDAQALSHFQAYGLNEGRHFSPLVDLSFYRASTARRSSKVTHSKVTHNCIPGFCAILNGRFIYAVV